MNADNRRSVDPRPLLLDLFCGAGGAGMGYHRAGFRVVGIDIAPQPYYPFPMVIGDATTWPIRGVDAVHASPPCQGYTSMNNRHGSSAPLLIDTIRARLRASGLPWVLENVTGARRHMPAALLLHGGMFGLDVWRPRLFDSSHVLLAAPARRPLDAAAVYGKQDGRRLWDRADGTMLRAASLDRARSAMDMPWADWDGIREAIPPAYTEHIGRQLIGAV